MKVNELLEMTLNVPTTQTDEKVQPYFDYLKQHGHLIGEQDGLNVYAASYNDIILYGIGTSDIITTVAVFKPEKSDLWVQHIVHTLQPYRNKQHIYKLLWFIKSQEGKRLISYGTHTSDGIKFIQNLSNTGRFDVYWYNTKTNDKIPYDSTTDGPQNVPYRSNIQMTDWRILIEKDDHPSFPRFDDDLVKWYYQVFD